MANFRFGINFHGPESVDTWLEHCRAAEHLGFDAVLAPDHLGAPAPFAMLAAAAVATERLRLGTYMVNHGFWNPAMLAREAATVDRLSGGRLELGLGLGHSRTEYEHAGIPWEPHGERLERLERGIGTLDRLFAEDGQEPLPQQCPRPPLMIGGHSQPLLALAARHADIVAYSGMVQAPAAPRRLRLVGVDEVERRVEFIRTEAGARADNLEFSALIQMIVLTDDRERSAAELTDRYSESGLETARKVLDNPFVLVGSAEEIAEEIIAHRKRYGFTYLVAHEPYRDALAQVIPLVREREGEQVN